jgi:hypothetical protein
MMYFSFYYKRSGGETDVFPILRPELISLNQNPWFLQYTSYFIKNNDHWLVAKICPKLLCNCSLMLYSTRHAFIYRSAHLTYDKMQDQELYVRRSVAALPKLSQLQTFIHWFRPEELYKLRFSSLWHKYQ